MLQCIVFFIWAGCAPAARSAWSSSSKRHAFKLMHDAEDGDGQVSRGELHEETRSMINELGRVAEGDDVLDRYAAAMLHERKLAGISHDSGPSSLISLELLTICEKGKGDRRDGDSCQQDCECAGELVCKGGEGFGKCMEANVYLQAGEPCKAKSNECDPNEMLVCRPLADGSRYTCQKPGKVQDRCNADDECDQSVQGVRCRGGAGNKMCQYPLSANSSCAWRGAGAGSDCKLHHRCRADISVCVQVCIAEGQGCESGSGAGCCAGTRCVGGMGSRTCRSKPLQVGEKCEWNGIQTECEQGLSCVGQPGKSVCSAGGANTPCNPLEDLSGGISECGPGMICNSATERCEGCVGLGKFCKTQQSCCPGSTCDPHNNICVEAVGLGQMCILGTNQNNCGWGMSCSGYTNFPVCQQTCLYNGASCTMNAECCGGYCVGSTCQRGLKNENEACDGGPNKECLPGLECRGKPGHKICSHQFRENWDCNIHNDCNTQAGWFCLGVPGQKKCRLWLDAGARCDPNEENSCSEGLVCNPHVSLCQEFIEEDGLCENAGRLLCANGYFCLGPAGLKTCRKQALKENMRCDPKVKEFAFYDEIIKMTRTEDECDYGLKCDANSGTCKPVCLRADDKCGELDGISVLRCCRKNERNTWQDDLQCRGGPHVQDRRCSPPLQENDSCHKNHENECEEGLYCCPKLHKCLRKKVLTAGANCEGEENFCDKSLGLACRGPVGHKRCQVALQNGQACDPHAKSSQCIEGLVCDSTDKICKSSAVCCVCSATQIVWSPKKENCDAACNTPVMKPLGFFGATKDCVVPTQSDPTFCSTACSDNLKDSLNELESACSRLKTKETCDGSGCTWGHEKFQPRCQATLKNSVCNQVGGNCGMCTEIGCKFFSFTKQCHAKDFTMCPIKGLYPKNNEMCEPQKFYEGVTPEHADELENCMFSLNRQASTANKRKCKLFAWRQALLSFLSRAPNLGVEASRRAHARSMLGPQFPECNDEIAHEDGKLWWEKNMAVITNHLPCALIHRRAAEMAAENDETLTQDEWKNECAAFEYGASESGRNQFESIRTLFHGDADNFIASLEAPLTEHDGLFHARTADGKFVIYKCDGAIPPDTLLKMLKNDELYKHFKNNPNSLLQHVYAMIRVKLPKNHFPDSEDSLLLFMSTPTLAQQSEASSVFAIRPDNAGNEGIQIFETVEGNVKLRSTLRQNSPDTMQWLRSLMGPDDTFLARFHPSTWKTWKHPVLAKILVISTDEQENKQDCNGPGKRVLGNVCTRFSFANYWLVGDAKAVAKRFQPPIESSKHADWSEAYIRMLNALFKEPTRPKEPKKPGDGKVEATTAKKFPRKNSDEEHCLSWSQKCGSASIDERFHYRADIFSVMMRQSIIAMLPQKVKSNANGKETNDDNKKTPARTAKPPSGLDDDNVKKKSVEDWDTLRFVPPICETIVADATAKGNTCFDGDFKYCEVTSLGTTKFQKLRQPEAQPNGVGDVSGELDKALKEGPLVENPFWDDDEVTHYATQDGKFLLMFDKAGEHGTARADALKQMVVGTEKKPGLYHYFRRNKNSLLLRVYGLYKMRFFNGCPETMNCPENDLQGGIEEYYVTVMRHPTLGYFTRLRPEFLQVYDLRAYPEGSYYAGVYKNQNDKIWEQNGVDKAHWHNSELRGKPYTLWNYEDLDDNQFMISAQEKTLVVTNIESDLDFLSSWHRIGYSYVMGIARSSHQAKQIPSCSHTYRNIMCFNSEIDRDSRHETHIYTLVFFRWWEEINDHGASVEKWHVGSYETIMKTLIKDSRGSHLVTAKQKQGIENGGATSEGAPGEGAPDIGESKSSVTKKKASIHDPSSWPWWAWLLLALLLLLLLCCCCCLCFWCCRSRYWGGQAGYGGPPPEGIAVMMEGMWTAPMAMAPVYETQPVMVETQPVMVLDAQPVLVETQNVLVDAQPQMVHTGAMVFDGQQQMVQTGAVMLDGQQQFMETGVVQTGPGMVTGTSGVTVVQDDVHMPRGHTAW